MSRFLALLLFAFPLTAQHSEVLEVRLVEIDAVVTDREGRPVTGLGPEDFDLFENGKRQEITNFAAVAGVSSESRESATPATASAPAPRTIVLLIDTLRIFGPARRTLFADLRSLVDRIVRDGDRAQMFVWHDLRGMRAATSMTGDRPVLHDALRKLEGGSASTPEGESIEERAEWLRDVKEGSQFDTGIDIEAEIQAATRQLAESQFAVMRRKTAAMQRLLASLGGTKSKSVMIYVSGMFPLIAGKTSLGNGVEEQQFSTRGMLEAIVRTANAQDVVFYGLRPERMAMPPIGAAGSSGEQAARFAQPMLPNVDLPVRNEVEALERIAQETGGTVDVGPAGIAKATDRLDSDLGSYYTLAWHTRRDAGDSERRIEVRTKNPAYVVRAQRSLVHRSDKTRARDLVVSRLLERGSAGDVDFDITVGKGQPVQRGRALIPVQLSIPVDQLRFEDDGTELAARFSVLAVAGTNIAQVTEVKEDSRRVTAPRGTVPDGVVTYKLELLADRKPITVSIGVFDEQSGLAGTRSISIQGTQATVDPRTKDPAIDAQWREVLGRAERERKPIVVFYRPRRCKGCRAFEENAVSHPTIQRRLPAVIFTKMPANEGEAAGIALFDHAGTLRARWTVIPDTTNFGVLLDAVAAVAPHFERAVDLAQAGEADAGEVEAAVALARLGRVDEAKAALNQVIAEARTPRVIADASMVLGAIHRSSGAAEEPIPENRAIRILPFERQVVSGPNIVKTNVTSPSIARVSFSLDGHEVTRVDRAPFSARLDFGKVPERHVVGVVAFAADGKEIGRDEWIVNDGGETFWVRLTSPREGMASGNVRVTMNVRVPPARRITRMVLSWNDAVRAVLTEAPWEKEIDIPEGRVGVLRAVAELDDGRTSEDAALLNASGYVEQSNVQLVQLPITILGNRKITAAQIHVREGKKTRRVESVATAEETPLTVGLLIDSSASMKNSLPDVQEAAIRFLETLLGPHDRAFLITFDTSARIVQQPTSDVALLRAKIASIRPEGLTAVHDAIALGLLQFEGIKGRRAMIVFSDGVDRTSRYEAAEVGELAKRSGVPIHWIAAKPDFPRGLNVDALPNTEKPRTAYVPNAMEKKWMRAFDAIARLAKSTGGASHVLENLGELPQTYARIESALRAQILAFVRTDPATAENEWRDIDVTISASGVDVRAPVGYYAIW